MSNFKFKIIICLLFVSVFSVSFSFPINFIHAQKSLLLPNTFVGTVVVNQNLPISVRTSDNLAGVTINFLSAAQGVSFSPFQCVTNSSGSCTVSFKSTNIGTFNIGITATGYTTASTVPIQVVAATSVNTDTTYTLLAPLPGLETIDTQKNTSDNKCPFGNYLNIMIKIFIGFAAVLAMVMIVLGGMEYMTSELISSKEHGKERIRNAILGLLIALGAYLILNTINPQLLDICLDKIETVKIEIKDEPEPGIQTDSVVLQNVAADKTTPTITLQVCKPEEMQTITVFGKSVEVYKGVVDSLRRIDAKWQTAGGANFYKVDSIGGYNCRRVKGKPTYWSLHAYGLAVDINPETNPYGPTKKTDMPIPFTNYFQQEMWGWGGAWTNVKDPMHYGKLAGPEGGDSKVEVHP